MILRTAAGRHATFVYPMLHIPDEAQFVCAIPGVMNGCAGQHNNLPKGNKQKHQQRQPYR